MAKRRIEIDKALNPFIQGAGKAVRNTPKTITYTKPIIMEKQGTHRIMQKSFNEAETNNKLGEQNNGGKQQRKN